jgi:integrase
MARPLPAVPRYLHHKSTGRAYVKVGGRFTYLGRYGSPDSRERYARLVRDHHAAGPAVAANRATGAAIDPAGLTVAAVLAAFWNHAKVAYPYDPSYDGRRPPGEIGNFWDAMRPVLRLYGGTPAVDFGPLALSLVQGEMVAMDWCRNVINRHTARVKHIFKWAVAQELLPGEVHHRLSAATGLRRGHKGVRNTAKVRPVPAGDLNATLRFCTPRIAAMVQLQVLTGMRSTNLCQIRTADVDTSGGPGGGGNWVYTPRTHKTAHHGHELAIRLGPKAQEVLRPYLKPDRPEAFVFSPADEAADRRAARTAARVTPLSCGNRPGSKPAVRSPRRPPGDHYTHRTYAQAIDRACDKADRWARGGMIIGDDERAIPRWNPHRLRHNRGTIVRRTHGLDGVQAALGQKTAAVAAMYAEIEAEKADRIAAELG